MSGLPKVLAALLAVCAAAANADEAAPDAARAVLVRHQCHRCHEIPGVAPVALEKSCAECHRDISAAAGDAKKLAEGRKQYGAHFNRFVARTGTLYVNVPALWGMGRFRAQWLRAFLRSPYDLRPNLKESMIRSNLSDAEIELLVTGWGAVDGGEASSEPSKARLARGAELFDQKGCGACHLFGNLPLSTVAGYQFRFTPEVRSRALAPDLRHARDRLTRQTVLAILRDPQAVNPRAEMPKPALSEEERALIADFILFGQPGKTASATRPSPPPYDGAAKAKVPTYAEVEREVFKKVCWHCHSDPDFNFGDGGPGNSGGFGFAAAGLSFASWMDVMSGSIGPDGKRRSVLRKGPSGEPVLLERLRARYHENARDFVLPGQDALDDRRAPRTDAPRGMPLGLPALTPEQFSLVERWVRGGAPQ